MKREPLPFYPLIVATFPVVSVYAANLAYVPTGQIVRPLLIVLVATALLVAALGAVFRNWARGAAAATVLVLCLFAYGWFIDRYGRSLMDQGISTLWTWGFLTLAFAGLAGWLIRRSKALNVLATFIAMVSLANLGLALVRSARLAERAPRGQLGEAAQGPKPDVFYIILDGHGRTDSVRRFIGYDDSAFVKGLQKRGFYVADKSRSNYCQTELSLASSLNMDTIPRLLPRVDPKTENRTPLAKLVDENEAARRFRAQGYRFLAVTSGFPSIQFSSADLHIGTRWGGTMVESTLLQMTPLAAQSGLNESQFDARRKNLVGAFANLADLATPTIQPRFVVAHILAPHPPFVFKADGTPQARVGGYGYWDGDDFTIFSGGNAEDYRRGYAGQAAWTDGQVLKVVDRLLSAASPKRPPIIVIQGDHGSKVRLAQNSLAKTDLHECFPILNAYFVPQRIRQDLQPAITPINTFRTVLRDLFGEDLPDLPNRSWYSGYATPYALTDVTDRVELTESRERESLKPSANR